MTDLNSAIRQLRQALEATFSSDPTARLELREATVTLGLSVAPNTAGGANAEARWCVVDPGTPAQHTVTLRLESRSQPDRNGIHATVPADGLHPSSSLSDPDLAPAASNAWTNPGLPSASEDAALAERCLPVFGPPGFDNAARAEVFCEISQGFEPVELLRAIQLADSEAKVPAEDPHAHAVTRLRQILKFSPEGPKKAAQILLSILRDGHKAALQTLLARQWRFGMHWDLPSKET